MLLRVALLSILALSALAQTVVDVTGENFDATVAGHEFVIVEFYAPWCGHCKKLEPEYVKAAEAIQSKAVLAKVDATVHEELAKRFEIRGFPTIKVFRDGQLFGDYEGGRSAADIEKYVVNNAGPAVKDASASGAVEELKKAHPVVVVLYATQGNPAFDNVAKAMRASAIFAWVSSEASFGSESAGITLFKQFDEKREVFSGDVESEEAIRKFVSQGSIRIFDEIGPENFRGYVSRRLPIAWVFVDATPASQEAKAAAAEAAKSFRGKLSFVWIDATKYGQMAQRLGLKGDKFPAFTIDLDNSHFAYDESAEITTEKLVTFAEAYLAGTLPKTIRSETAPEPHTVEGLTTVVGSTFDELVLADKDVLIEFYAPWCGHCKTLAPIYEEVAAVFKDVDNVRVAKIDATANDYDQKLFPVQGFPTIFFVPANSKTPVSYEGDRKKEAFVQFIKDKSSKPLDHIEL